MHAAEAPRKPGLPRPPERERARSTFIRIFSYSVFISLCLLLLTLGILYYSFKSIVTREIHTQSIHMLVQARSIFDSLHEWIVPSFRQIRSEPAIATLVNSPNPDRIDISAGFDRLIEVLSSYSLVDSIYVYNHQTGHYFSTINGYEGTECSDAFLPEILNDIRRFGVYRYIPRKMVYRIHDNVYRADFAETASVNVFSIVVGDMPKSGAAIGGALVVNLDEQKIIDNFFPSAAGSGGRPIIVDRAGMVLSHPDPRQFGAAFGDVSYVRTILASGREQGVFTDTAAGVRYLVSYTTHPAWGWRFIHLIPYDEIFSQMTGFLVRAGIVFILLMLLSVGLAYVSSRRIYSPIHKLFKDAARLADTVEKQQELVKQEIVRRLILDELDAEAPGSWQEVLDGESEEGPFVVAVLRLDGFHRLSETYPAEELSRFFHVLKELVFRHVPACRFVLPLPKDHLCVICRPAVPGTLEEAFSTVQETARRQSGITVTVGLSDLFAGFASLHEVYSACLAATQLRFRLGGGSLIPVRELDRRAGAEYLFPEEKLRLLFQELALGRVARVEQILDEILCGIREHSFEDFGFMAQSIAYQTSKYIEKLGAGLKDSAITLKGLLQPVRSAETLAELKGRLMEIYTLIAEICQKKQGSRLQELAEKTRAHIERHFQDVSLCTDSLAEAMGVTAYYIRFAYKKAFGDSLSEAINRLRLEHCKERLLNTRLPVKKIYTAAGFCNYSYFFTLFKKNTGLTPNQFRFQKPDSRQNRQ